MARNPFHGCSTFVPEPRAGGGVTSVLESLQSSCANESTYGVTRAARGGAKNGGGGGVDTGGSDRRLQDMVVDAVQKAHSRLG